MPHKDKHREPNSEYLVTTYRNLQRTEEVVYRKQMLLMTSEGIDFYYNEVKGEVEIQRREGKPIKYPHGMPKLGPKTWKLLTELMWAAGEYLTPEELYRRTRDLSLRNSQNLGNLVRRLRRFFCESAKHPYYLWTNRHPQYSVCWDEHRSWRTIERLAQPDVDDETE